MRLNAAFSREFQRANFGLHVAWWRGEGLVAGAIAFVLIEVLIENPSPARDRLLTETGNDQRESRAAGLACVPVLGLGM
jgi:hypothetical protein